MTSGNVDECYATLMFLIYIIIRRTSREFGNFKTSLRVYNVYMCIIITFRNLAWFKKWLNTCGYTLYTCEQRYLPYIHKVLKGRTILIRVSESLLNAIWYNVVYISINYVSMWWLFEHICAKTFQIIRYSPCVHLLQILSKNMST